MLVKISDIVFIQMKLKAMQHELGCMTATLRARTSELEVWQLLTSPYLPPFLLIVHVNSESVRHSCQTGCKETL